MRRPKVSVIVPIYNVEQHLKRCVNSLINQTLKNIEIILVDDGSPDGSPEICDYFAEKDNRIKVIHKLNEGLGYARNSGLNIATGEYIAFVDSDDYVSHSMFEVLYSKACENKLDALFCGYYVEFKSVQNKRIEVSEVNTFKMFEGKEKSHEILLDMIGAEPTFRHDRKLSVSVWHGIYNSKYIESNELLFCSERELISEDIIFHIDFLSRATRIGYVPDCLMYYIKDNQTSLTNSYNAKRFVKVKELHYEILGRLKGNGIHGVEVSNRVKRLFIGNIRSIIFKICAYGGEIDKKRELLAIVSDPIWKEIFDEYPISRLPFRHKIVMYAIKFKLIGILQILSLIHTSKK